MTLIVIIHGPMACGKTRNKQALMHAFRCDHAIDDWDGRESLSLTKFVRGTGVVPIGEKCLVLTNNPNPRAPSSSAEIYSFGEAMRKSGLAN